MGTRPILRVLFVNKLSLSIMAAMEMETAMEMEMVMEMEVQGLTSVLMICM